MSNGGYPPGAQCDSNAPFNKPMTIEELFGPDMAQDIDEEIDSHHDAFVEWLVSSDKIDEDAFDGSMEALKAGIDAYCNDEKIRAEYHKYRRDYYIEQYEQYYGN